MEYATSTSSRAKVWLKHELEEYWKRQGYRQPSKKIAKAHQQAPALGEPISLAEAKARTRLAEASLSR